MTKGMKAVLVVLVAGTAWAGDKLTDEQLKAKFYNDLGPATIDVSAYPKQQQDNYAVFAKTCAQCHTLARPINASLIKREDWKRYISRMHLKTKVTSGTSITKEEAATIADFLTFDAKIRKVDGKAAFDAQTDRLKKLFKDVEAERSSRQKNQDEKKVKEAPMPGQGVTPQP
jgi:cytochrome c5